MTKAQRKKLLVQAEAQCRAISEISKTIEAKSAARGNIAFSLADEDLLILFKFTRAFLPAIVNISGYFQPDKKAMRAAEKAWKRGLKLAAKYESAK